MSSIKGINIFNGYNYDDSRAENLLETMINCKHVFRN